MKTPQCNLDLYQGNDDIFVLRIEEVDNEGNRTMADLSGYWFILRVRENPLSPVLMELSVDNRCISYGVIDEDGNFREAKIGEKPYALQLHFPHADTEKLHAPKYEYDLFGVKPDGIREVLLRGDIKVVRSITYGKNCTRHY